MLFADLLSLHLVTFLMFFNIVHITDKAVSVGISAATESYLDMENH